MVDLEKLKAIIGSSGMKVTVLCEKAGMNRQVLYNKLSGKGDFTVNEIQNLADNLHLTTKERNEIFFAKQVN